MDLIIMLAQMVIFFGSWVLPSVVGDYWARSNSRPRPRPDPNDPWYDDKRLAARIRELDAIERAEYAAYYNSGQFVGVILVLGCAVLAYYLPVIVYRF